MKKYFTIEELFGAFTPKTNILLRGDYWKVEYINEKYLLSFISGEIVGVEKILY